MKPRLAVVASAFLAVVAFTVPSVDSPSTQVTAAAAPVIYVQPLVAQSGSEPVIVVTTTTTEPPPPPTTEEAPPPVAQEAPPPPPPPDPEPAPQPDATGDAAYDAVMQWFPDNFDSAWRVSGCESGHDPSSVSKGGGNWGLFQINTVHQSDFEAVTGHPWSDVLDAFLNAQYAKHLYDASGGWGPWTCRWAA